MKSGESTKRLPFRMSVPNKDGSFTEERLSVRLNRALARFRKAPAGTKLISPTGIELTVRARGIKVNMDKVLVRLGRMASVQLKPVTAPVMHAGGIVVGMRPESGLVPVSDEMVDGFRALQAANRRTDDN